MAKLVTKYEFAGAGCLVQALGLMLAFLWPFGTLVGIGLLFYGSAMSKKYRCGNCGNKIDDKQVRLCPSCRETIEP